MNARRQTVARAATSGRAASRNATGHGFPQFLRSPALLTLAILLGLSHHLRAADELSDAEVAGRTLAAKILAQQPAENFTNTGVLKIRDGNGKRSTYPIAARTLVTPGGWEGIYEVTGTNANVPDGYVGILHVGSDESYFVGQSAASAPGATNGVPVSWRPFAGSDFWIGDLGLGFLHWPAQKVIKKEFHRNCPCTVLESTNPDPATNGYSRVVCWIDNDSLGIVEAYGYDATGRKLKNFYPKDLAKVNGQYRVQSMVMENLRTGSRSILDFDVEH